jgi:hypothetical protein
MRPATCIARKRKKSLLQPKFGHGLKPLTIKENEMKLAK